MGHGVAMRGSRPQVAHAADGLDDGCTPALTATKEELVDSVRIRMPDMIRTASARGQEADTTVVDGSEQPLSTFH